MNQLVASAQRILKNKNVVTVLGIIVALVLLYWGYSSQINNAVQPVRVPVAIETIQPRTEITADMIDMVDMPAVSIGDNVIRTRNDVVGKYSNINAVIPAGSMFYTDTVVDQSKLPDSVFVKVKKGEVVYNFPVDMESTYGNSIYPGNKIDIYMKTGDGNDEKVMLGKLVENIEVLAVKDSAGRNVFENTSETRIPDMLIFGVPEDINLLLRKASYMENLGVELFPVPHGGSVSTEGATEVSTQQLADYIEAHAVNIPVPVKEEKDTLLPTITQKNGKVTIKYKKGCGSTYTCTYTKDEGTPVTVTTNKIVVTFAASGKISATLVDKNKKEHTTTEEITITPTNNAASTANTPNTTNSVNGVR